jgi:hypothetical protein
MQTPDFDRRNPAFREGFMAFLVGTLDNPYIRYPNGKPFIHNGNVIRAKEWQHGSDVAYLLTQHLNSIESAPYDA